MKNSALSALGQRIQPPPISWLMQLALSRPKLISLAAGFTDNAALPCDEVRVLTNELLRSKSRGQAALQYGATQGDPVLRERTAEHFRRLDGIAAGARAYSAERAIITHGSQQLLYMATEALCEAGDIVLVEDPTYFVYLGILQSHGVAARGVRMEKDGLDLEHLAAVLASLQKTGDLRRVKALYLVTYFQNPTGITTSFEKKAAALRLLKQYERKAGHPIYLLEDVAYRELRFTGDDIPSALAVPGAAGRVIYAGTYSKPFATGVRVGFGFLPEPMFSTVLRIKGNHDFGTANLSQQILARALSSGLYRRHLAELRRRYAAKAEAMRRALQKHFPPEVEWEEPGGGLYFWARLPRGNKSGIKSEIFQAALRREVLYVPGGLCYADDAARAKPDREMRLSFGGATIPNIQAGAARLGGVLRDCLAGKIRSR